MNKYFITGLIILLPLALTILIIAFLFNFLTSPFLGLVKAVFDYYGFFEQGFWFLSASQIQTIVAQLLILFCLFFLTVGLGFIARWFFFRSLIKIGELLFKKIPFVRSIYKTSKDVIHTIFTSKEKSFKQVVLVRFPNQSTYSIGFLTREDIPSLRETIYQDIVTVFVPTTPNPTSGFLVMYKKQDLVYLDMKVEDAFKYIISCGLVTSDDPLPDGFDHDLFVP